MRVLIIKVETDEDLDPSLSQRSWSEALALAQELGDAGWVNRPRGEVEVTALVHRGAEPGELALIEHGFEEHDRSIMRPGAVGFRKRLSGSPMAAQSGL